MNNSLNVKQCDVLIIGAGLAGLTAGLKLQRMGRQVMIVDKRRQVGGLCGTFQLDDYEFVIACNDFGSGLIDLLRSLGVGVEFIHKKTLIYYKNQFYDAAPSLATVWHLRHHWRDLLSLATAIARRIFSSSEPVTIEDFIDLHTQQGPVNDLAKVFCYFMGAPPYDMMTSFFGLDKEYGYGYNRMACPVGGPQKLVDAIAEELTRQGGIILLDSAYLGHRKDQGFVVDVSHNGQQQCILADNLVNTAEQSEAYPDDTKRGLPLSMMCVVVDSDFSYPENVHTLCYYESNISEWFRDLDQGKKPREFGFHVFSSDLNQAVDYYTLNVYFYLPRGQNSLTSQDSESYKEYLLNRVEYMLPGINKAIRYTEIITPERFKEIHDLSSRVMPYISYPYKPSNIGQEQGLYFAGHTVYPPGEHAGAAALSGYLVADKILESHTKQ